MEIGHSFSSTSNQIPVMSLVVWKQDIFVFRYGVHSSEITVSCFRGKNKTTSRPLDRTQMDVSYTYILYVHYIFTMTGATSSSGSSCVHFRLLVKFEQFNLQFSMQCIGYKFSLFVLFLLGLILSLHLRCMASDYFFGIFTPFYLSGGGWRVAQ